ncbi:MAG: peptidase M22, partial [Clostridia bacterium]|nr:peptidase M22 [Clostridia bacterium]
TVKSGEVGLRQSDAVFLHTRNFPALFKEAEEYLRGRRILAIGVSSRPRNQEGSYMPCFLSGVAVANALASTHSVPLYSFSHQCGHITSAVLSSGALHLFDGREFASLHISGGTTEILRSRYNDFSFEQTLVGGSSDLNAGQVIDRIGVFLGLPFPAGVHLEQLALTCKGKIPKRKITVNNGYINLSGLENMAKRLYSDTSDKSLVAAFVLDFITRSIIAMVDAYIESFGDTEIVFAGGVMSNKIIRTALDVRYRSHFAEPELSRDNAVGIAYLAYKKYTDRG